MRTAAGLRPVTMPHADLWPLALGSAQIDPAELAAAIERELSLPVLDFRTRLLIRDALAALEHVWGRPRFENWFAHLPSPGRVQAIAREDLGVPGFPSLRTRLMEPTKPEIKFQF